MAAVSVRFAGTVTNNGVPVAGTAQVTTTSAPSGASGVLSWTGRFSVSVNAQAGDTVTLIVDNGTKFTGTSLMSTPIAGYPYDLSCDIGTGSISNLKRFL